MRDNKYILNCNKIKKTIIISNFWQVLCSTFLIQCCFSTLLLLFYFYLFIILQCLQDMKRKISNLKDYHSSLMEMLSDMLAEHFPLPDPQGNGTKKKRVGATFTLSIRSENIGFRFFF